MCRRPLIPGPPGPPRAARAPAAGCALLATAGQTPWEVEGSGQNPRHLCAADAPGQREVMAPPPHGTGGHIQPGSGRGRGRGGAYRRDPHQHSLDHLLPFAHVSSWLPFPPPPPYLTLRPARLSSGLSSGRCGRGCPPTWSLSPSSLCPRLTSPSLAPARIFRLSSGLSSGRCGRDWPPRGRTRRGGTRGGTRRPRHPRPPPGTAGRGPGRRE